MKVLIIGGSGLLGSEAAWALSNKGHQVIGLSLPPLPQDAAFPSSMVHHFGSYLDLSDEELTALLVGCEGLVFATGVDERVKTVPPVLDFYRKYNNEPLKRILPLAKAAGVRHVVVLGSYFSHFNRVWPRHNLEQNHPYIKSRVEQEAIAKSHAGPGFDVAVLELPYIFGTQPGRKPVWVFLVVMLRGMRPFAFFPPGGTAMVTAKQVGQAILGALERNTGYQAYPIGFYNLTWLEMLGIFHEAMGCPNKRIITIPVWMFKIGTIFIQNRDKKKGLVGGLDLPKFAPVMGSEAFIDKSLGSVPLGIEEDDIKKAITASVKQSLQAMEGSASMVEMQNK